MAERKTALERKLAADIISTISKLRNLGWTDYQIQREIEGMIKYEIKDLKAGSSSFLVYALIVGIVVGSFAIAVVF